MSSQVHERRYDGGQKGMSHIHPQLIRLKDLKSINVPRKEDYKIETEYAKAI